MVTDRNFAQDEDEDATAELARLHTENAALRSRLDRRRMARRWMANAMVVLSALLVVASTVGVWTYRTAFDTDRFMATVGPALDDQSFYTALGDRVSEQTLAALDLETRVPNRLAQLDEYVSEALVDALDVDPERRELLARFDRPTLASLAPPIASALEDRVDQIVHALVSSDAFRSRFPDLVRQAHEAGVALMRNDLAELPNVYLADGEVRLNLIPIIRDAIRQVIDEIGEFLPDVNVPEAISARVGEGRQQLGDALQAQLSADFGQVTLMSSEALGETQQAVRRLDQLVWALLLVTAASVAATVAVSPRRRRTIVQLGAAIIVGFILGAVVIRRLQAAILAEVQTPDGDRAARVLLAETMASLRTLVLIVAALAFVGAAIAYFAGKPAWFGRFSARASRLTAQAPGGSQLDRWIAAHFDVVQIAGIAVSVAIVFITGIDIVPVLVVGALLALFLWAIMASKSRAAHADPVAGQDELTPAPR